MHRMYWNPESKAWIILWVLCNMYSAKLAYPWNYGYHSILSYHGFWPLARRSGSRNSFVRWWFCAICSNFINFQLISSCIHLRTSLGMLKNRIKLHHMHYDMSGHVWVLFWISFIIDLPCFDRTIHDNLMISSFYLCSSSRFF